MTTTKAFELSGCQVFFEIRIDNDDNDDNGINSSGFLQLDFNYKRIKYSFYFYPVKSKKPNDKQQESSCGASGLQRRQNT